MCEVQFRWFRAPATMDGEGLADAGVAIVYPDFTQECVEYRGGPATRMCIVAVMA